MPPAKPSSRVPARKRVGVARSASSEAAEPSSPDKHSSEDYASAAQLFRALSHPLRVKLVCGLLHEPLTQTGIARLLGLSQSLVAQHLAVLRRAGIVRGTRQGGEVLLRVTDSRLPGIFASVCGNAEQFLAAGWDELSRETDSGG
jgi:DNA-binding transcriptional ArsR family regulator